MKDTKNTMNLAKQSKDKELFSARSTKENTFTYCNTLNKKMDVYIFVLCNNYKININNIKKLLNIDKIPKKMFNNFNIKEEFYKVLYTDKYEIIFYGIPKEKKCSNFSLFNTFGIIGKRMNENDYLNKKICISLVDSDKNIIQNQVVSYILGKYQFNELKSNTKDNINTTYFYHKNKNINIIIQESINQSLVQNEIRSLVNQPVNILNSSNYISYIKKNIDNNKVKITILDENKLKKIGCNLILAVNKGSSNKCAMVILEYKNIKDIKKENKPIALIGKGVMYDTGGYNLKLGDMSDMKCDMTGSAIVFGTIKLLSENNIEGHYIGLLPIVQNEIGANAIKPGDIVKSYIGKTVEIIDTDAEGRLILADALGYARNYNPYLCIDIATLTGQASQIFGDKSTVIMGNNNKYIQKIIKNGIDNNEKMWDLPIWFEYIDMTKSNIADLKNYSKEVSASSIMASAFLYNFIPNKSNWMHLDIAGVSYLDKETNSRISGGTGEILRTLYSFLIGIDKDAYEK
jgi:leucyl aminopeptidase